MPMILRPPKIHETCVSLDSAPAIRQGAESSGFKEPISTYAAGTYLQHTIYIQCVKSKQHGAWAAPQAPAMQQLVVSVLHVVVEARRRLRLFRVGAQPAICCGAALQILGSFCGLRL